MINRFLSLAFMHLTIKRIEERISFFSQVTAATYNIYLRTILKIGEFC